MPYCASCGAEIKDLTQNFCEQCGSPIPDSVRQAQPASTPVRTTPTMPSGIESYHRAGGLFDLNRNYYILKEKYWDWGSGDILDEKNQPIGRMKRVILSIRRRVELQEIDGTISATIHSKIISARGAQDLKDPQGNLIARIKKKILSFFRPVFYLEDPNGNQWFRAQGKFMGFSFKVYDVTTGNVVAEIEKADKWRDLFLGGLFDFKDTYALRILDNETDRRILLGFVLSIDNVLHDS
ncbi:MAG: LURP-one-related family protein [Candidatus Hermodarchaeota archaeon]